MSEVKVNKISPRTNCGTVTLGDSGDTFSIPAGVTLTNSGTATGFGPTGAVSWNTTKITADPNPAVSGVGYFADTTSSAFTVTLPASPSAGDIVAISDYTGTWTTNNLTVGRNSSNINGVAADLILNQNNTTATLIYVDGTEGWRVIDTGSLNEVNGIEFVAATGGCIAICGDYKIHTFTGPGTFTVTSAGNPLGSTTVDYLVVAGGGGGGKWASGGGAAGGFRESVPSPAAWTASPLANPGGALPVTAQGYPITVGGGGPAATAPAPSNGGNGNNSVFSTITSTGGGYGAGYNVVGNPGGSGGGGGHPSQAGGTGNSPPTSPSQGFSGGTGNTGGPGAGAGGGGATEAGVNGISSGPFGAGRGGAGATTSISGSSTAYADGGGGGSDNANVANGGPGGTGGDGGGQNCSPRAATAGTTNRGGGGGGVGGPAAGPAGAGGSGIVIIRYKFQ
jgi:hypothetical protein